MRVGTRELAKIGVKRFDPADPYHFALTIAWPAFFLYLLLAYIAISFVFATIFLFLPGSVSHMSPGSVIHAYFYSFETLSGSATGDRYPTSLIGHVVTATEVVTGIVFSAIMTGLMFVRFSKPRAKILFADNAVIAQHNGVQTLMIRVANGRANALTNVRVELNALIREVSQEGVVFHNVHSLRLVRDTTPVFPLTITLMHEIDQASALAGLDIKTTSAGELMLFCSITALDPALGAEVNDLRTYDPTQILTGMRFVDATSQDEAGRNTADLTKISLVELDPSA